MDTVTQWQKILDFCAAHGSTTNQDCYRMGINSPTKRISEMRYSGKYIVETEVERKYDADGKYLTRYNRYWIREA